MTVWPISIATQSVLEKVTGRCTQRTHAAAINKHEAQCLKHLCISGHSRAARSEHTTRGPWFRQRAMVSQHRFLAAAGVGEGMGTLLKLEMRQLTCSQLLCSLFQKSPMWSCLHSFFTPRKLAPLRIQKAVFKIYFFLYLSPKEEIECSEVLPTELGL